ncbi:Cupredoxin [Geopyxis carbonaria]|nr:Cupredoxin [Geopyxis carbonaria]
MHLAFLPGIFAFLSLLFAASTRAGAVPRAHITPDRSKWGDYDIHTDYEHTWPDTGVVREYWLTIENTTLAADGILRPVLAFNGTMPGPTISADWGDTVIVHLKNNLAHNGTGIHFHGLRQLYNNAFDGVPGVTECPLAPGDTKTYTWRATQYGTSWYHSHLSLQYSEGASGAIVVRGPSSSDWDEDLGPLVISDWYHVPLFTQYAQAKRSGPSTADNALINGTNVFGAGGKRCETPLQKGKRYLLRLVNAATDNHFKVSLDHHKFTVVAADFVPIVPVEVDWLDMAIGQRYDVVITASDPEDAAAYWFRAVAQEDCSFQRNIADVRGIFHYASSSAVPTTTAHPDPGDRCLDTPSSLLVPVVSRSPPRPADLVPKPLAVALTRSSTNLISWTVNTTPLHVSWSEPYTPANASSTYPLTLGEWQYVIVTTPLNISHPIHLHGHDFMVIGTGDGEYNPDTAVLTWENPARRDVATMPALGWMLIAWQADNAGRWLLHCHIAFHVSMGFGVVFDEGEDEKGLDMDGQGTCRRWRQWVGNGTVYEQEDSGV